MLMLWHGVTTVCFSRPLREGFRRLVRCCELRIIVALWLLAGVGFAERLPESFVEEASFYARSWPLDDAMTPYSVVGAVRRADGYLWAVTRGAVFRFDGAKYEVIPKTASSQKQNVYQPVSLMDRRNRLWLVKNGGFVVCVDGTNIRTFTVKDGVPGTLPVSIAEDGDGGILFSYFNEAKICRIQNERVETIGVAERLEGGSSVLLASGRDGKVWYSQGFQLGLFREGRRVPLLKHAKIVTRIIGARQGGVWFSDEKEVFRCGEGGSLESLGKIPEGSVKRLFEDRRGRLWVAATRDEADGDDSSESALFYHDGHGFKPVPIPYAGIMSLSDDAEGNLWLGTRRGGIIQVRERTVELLQPAGDAAPGVQSFCEGSDVFCFASGVFGMLSKGRRSAWERMTPQHGWRGVWGTSVVADPRGGVWLGTKNRGLFQWKDQKFSTVALPSKLSRQVIQALMLSASGDLWIGVDTADALFRLRDGKLDSLPLPPEHGNVCALAEDPSGTIWAGTDAGMLLRVNGDALMKITSSEQNPISSLHCTPDGSLWIGYEKRGLGRLKEGKFALFGPAQGIVEQSISQILPDERGLLWCAGRRGIFRMKLGELEAVAAGRLEKVQPVFSGFGEGWPILQASGEFWPRALRSRAGEICMSTSAGIAVIRMDRGIENPPTPAVVIERLSLNGQPFAAYESRIISRREQKSPLLDLHGLQERVSLGKGVRQLGVEFGVISFSGQENVRYRYRLEGLDDAWVETGSQRSAYFSQLPPGKYRFQVSACSNQGIWNVAGAAFDFKVEPFYWQTFWFRVVAMLAALLLVAGVIWYFARRRLRAEAELLRHEQALERERARIAEDLHDDLGARLTEVSLISSLGVRPATSLEKAKDYLKEVVGKSREMVEALDEIVWAVNPKRDDIPSVTSYLIHYAERFFEPTQIHCRLDVATDIPSAHMSSEQRHELFLAFKEALSNVARHSSATEVRLRVFVHDGIFRVQIEDNGCGIPEKTAGHGGDGISNMRMRLHRMGGFCDVRSADGKGTRVEFALPLSDSGRNGKETTAYLSGNNGDEVR